MKFPNQEDMIIDNKTIKVLSVDTRVKILQLLKEKDYTLSEISKKLNIANSTTVEHLNKLIEVNLIEKEDTKRKWKFYSLTIKGNRLANKKETRTIFILFVTILFSLFSLFSYNFLEYSFIEDEIMLNQDFVSAPMVKMRAENVEIASIATVEDVTEIVDEDRDIQDNVLLNNNPESLDEKKLIYDIKKLILYVLSVISFLLTGVFMGILIERARNKKILNK